MEKLALFGGRKTIVQPLRRYNPIDIEELEAASAVIRSGVLSQYIGASHADFYGGPKVLEFERMWAEYFGVKHAVSVNSLTSGLIAAVGALGIEPGDEVIVTPWTMSASATAVLHWNALPVFADIEPLTFCLDPASIEKNITPYTRAIMAVDIFGQSADMAAIMAVAEKHGLKVISDAAQAPGARYRGRYVGTLAHIGGFSLNYHKHIHTGEGGVMVTDDDTLAERMRLIRNHAEAVMPGRPTADLSNMIGHNFRLGEIECAIGIEQLHKLASFVAGRQRVAEQLTASLMLLQGLQTPVVRRDCTHAYYVYPLLLSPEIAQLRSAIASALAAEGVPGLTTSYQNLHLLPMYQRKRAYGSRGFPWSSELCRREISYAKGICPVAEYLQDTSFMGFPICMYELSEPDVAAIARAFHKVWDNLRSLASRSCAA